MTDRSNHCAQCEVLAGELEGLQAEVSRQINLRHDTAAESNRILDRAEAAEAERDALRADANTEVRLWDSQWVNVVNHDFAYRDWDMEAAISHAVKMTEDYIAANVRDNKLPPPRAALDAARSAKQNGYTDIISDGGLDPRERK